MSNPFDQFDAPTAQQGNPFDQFDEQTAPQSQQAPALTPAPRPTREQYLAEHNDGDLYSAINEPVRQAVSGGLAMIPAGLAGLGTMAGNAMGLTQREPGDVVRSVSERLTMQPRTQAGQVVSDVANYIPEKLAAGADRAGDVVNDATGSPALATATNMGLQAAAAALGAKVGAKVSRGNHLPSSADSATAARPEQSPQVPAASAKRAPGLESVPATVPTIEELSAAAKAAYKRADDAGVVVKANSITGLKTRIVSIVKKEGIDKDLHPDATAALNKITKSKGDLTLSEVETLRKVAKDAEGSIKPADKRLAGKIVDELDDYIDNLKDSDVVAGDATKAQALKEARGLYSRQKKAETLDALVERAKLTAPNFSGSGMENALRIQFKQLALNDRKMRMFTAEERDAIKKVAKGGKSENAFRFIGKYSPTGPVSGPIAGAVGFSVGGPVGAVALPLAGAVSRHIATRMTKNNVNAANELVRRGPQAPSQKAQRKQNALADF